ncbi:MAG: hypothetical protein V1646_01710 [bacterium]
MKNIFRALVILSVGFVSAKLQAVPTLMDCFNASTHTKMTLVTGGVTYINKTTTISNINIATSVTEVKIKPTGAIDSPIIFQKSALRIGPDGKYDLEIRTTKSGSSLIVAVYSLDKKLASKVFNIINIY